MAWVFSLSVECGPERESAEVFSGHFEGVSWMLSNSACAQCCTTVFQDIDENWWCRVCPDNVSEIGIEGPESAYLMTELGILLYQHLRLSPAFRYALVGVEVDEFRTYSELLEELSSLSFPGLTLSEITWRAMASPPTFRPFRSGYVWQPYKGEVYQPLMVSPTLKEQMDTLLVA